MKRVWGGGVPRAKVSTLLNEVEEVEPTSIGDAPPRQAVAGQGEGKRNGLVRVRIGALCAVWGCVGKLFF